jgi:hypothetical protein
LATTDNPIGDAELEFIEMEPQAWLHGSDFPHSLQGNICPRFTSLAKSAMQTFLSMESHEIPLLSFLLGYSWGGAWSHSPDGHEYDSRFDFVGIVNIGTLTVQLLEDDEVPEEQ